MNEICRRQCRGHVTRSLDATIRFVERNLGRWDNPTTGIVHCMGCDLWFTTTSVRRDGLPSTGFFCRIGEWEMCADVRHGGSATARIQVRDWCRANGVVPTDIRREG